MRRVDYLDDPAAPAANSLVPAVSAIVAVGGEILLHRRRDNGLWALPGGGMELGESITAALVREVAEETGLEVEPLRLVGVYSNPRHVVAFADGEVRQEFSLCFACRVVGGRLRASDESLELAFLPLDALDRLALHPSILQRVRDWREGRPGAAIR